MQEKNTIKVLFVCMGNICRSPTAEAVFRHAVSQAGLKDAVECDSVGTHGYHVGEPPDRRAQQAALGRGYDMSNLRGRQVGKKDFEQFDYIVAMDRHNLALLKDQCPKPHAHKLALFCDFNADYAGREVPDPYYGGPQGFEQVLDMIEAVSDSLIARLRQTRRG
ncbi:MAG: low molecular weight phosphotyrosine protein phosphatase [Betaproteobacteria bacterium]|nr:low molecular weight phosphotyrosine protein phosphatase [Betaproteobacteria bacterium]